MILFGINIEDTDILVFPSNTEGRHGAGLAKLAYMYKGAVYGFSRGRTGQSYAIITKDLRGGIITLSFIKEQIIELFQYANEHKEERFIFTKIGTGLAGFNECDIKNLLNGLERPDNIVFPKGW